MGKKSKTFLLLILAIEACRFQKCKKKKFGKIFPVAGPPEDSLTSNISGTGKDFDVRFSRAAPYRSPLHSEA